MSRLAFLLAALSLSTPALVGCIEKALTPEGESDGDCADGADNDADGLFDCDDDGCGAAPACATTSGDGSGGGGGGGGGGWGGGGDGDDSWGDTGWSGGDDSGRWGGGDDTGGWRDRGRRRHRRVALDTVAWGCDPEARVFRFEVYTAGRASGGALFIHQADAASPWDEQHPLAVQAADPAGYWTRLYLELPSAWPDPAAVTTGDGTLFSCDIQYSLDFAVEIDAPRGPGVDCARFGIPGEAFAEECPRTSAGALR